MMRLGIIIVLSLGVFVATITATNLNEEEEEEKHTLIHRLIRSAGAKKHECRYDKGVWEECDVNTGLQRRPLKLKTLRAPSHCEQVKFITRPCKKDCRYAKGAWTDCVNGERHRVDTIKTASVGCEPSRNITKKCKQVCRYSKSDWSPCEAGIKTKTLTLLADETGVTVTSQCEQNKVIRKQCGQSKQRAKHNKQRGRKNNVAAPSTTT